MRRHRPVSRGKQAEHPSDNSNLLAYLHAREHGFGDSMMDNAYAAKVWDACGEGDVSGLLSDGSLESHECKWHRLVDTMTFPMHPEDQCRAKPIELHPYLQYNPSVVCLVSCGSVGYASLYSSGQLVFYSYLRKKSIVQNDYTTNEMIRSVEFFDKQNVLITINTAAHSESDTSYTRVFALEDLEKEICFSTQQQTNETYTNYAEQFKQNECLAWVHDPVTTSVFFSKQKQLSVTKSFLPSARKRFKASMNIPEQNITCIHTKQPSKCCQQCVMPYILHQSLDVDWIEEPENTQFSILHGEKPGSIDWMSIAHTSTNNTNTNNNIQYLETLCRITALRDGIVVMQEDALLFMLYCSRMNNIDDASFVDILFHTTDTTHRVLPYTITKGTAQWCSVKHDVALSRLPVTNHEEIGLSGYTISPSTISNVKCCSFHMHNVHSVSPTPCILNSTELDFFIQYITNTSLHQNRDRDAQLRNIDLILANELHPTIAHSITRRITIQWYDMQFLLSCPVQPALYMLPKEYLTYFCAFFMYIYPHSLGAGGYTVNCLCNQGSVCTEEIEHPARWIIAENYVWGLKSHQSIPISEFYSTLIPSLLYRHIISTNEPDQTSLKKELLKMYPIIPPNKLLKETLDTVLTGIEHGNVNITWKQPSITDIIKIGTGHDILETSTIEPSILPYLLLASKKNRRVYLPDVEERVPVEHPSNSVQLSWLQKYIKKQIYNKFCSRPFTNANMSMNQQLQSPSFGSNISTPSFTCTPSRSKKRKIATSKGSKSNRGKRSRTCLKTNGRVSSCKNLFDDSDEPALEINTQESILLPSFLPQDILGISVVTGAEMLQKVYNKIRQFIVEKSILYIRENPQTSVTQKCVEPLPSLEIHPLSLHVSNTCDASVTPKQVLLPSHLKELTVAENRALLMQQQIIEPYPNHRPVTGLLLHPHFHHDCTLDILLQHGYIPEMQLIALNERTQKYKKTLVSLSSQRKEVDLTSMYTPGSADIPQLPSSLPVEHMVQLLSSAKLLQCNFVATDSSLLQQFLQEGISTALPIQKQVGILCEPIETILGQCHVYDIDTSKLAYTCCLSIKMICLLGGDVDIPEDCVSCFDSASYRNTVQLSDGFLIQFTALPCIFIPYNIRSHVQCGVIADGNLMNGTSTSVLYSHTQQVVDKQNIVSSKDQKVIDLDGPSISRTSHTSSRVNTNQTVRTPHYTATTSKTLATPIRMIMMPRNSMTLPATPQVRQNRVLTPQILSPTRLLPPNQPLPVTPRRTVLDATSIDTTPIDRTPTDTTPRDTTPVVPIVREISTYLNRRLSALSSNPMIPNVLPRTPSVSQDSVPTASTPHTSYGTMEVITPVRNMYLSHALPESDRDAAINTALVPPLQHMSVPSRPETMQRQPISPMQWNFDTQNIQLSPLLASPTQQQYTPQVSPRTYLSRKPILSPPALRQPTVHYILADNLPPSEATTIQAHISISHQYAVYAVPVEKEYTYQYQPQYEQVNRTTHRVLLSNIYYAINNKHSFSIVPLLFCFDACLPCTLSIRLRHAYIREFVKIVRQVDNVQMNTFLHSIDNSSVRTTNIMLQTSKIGQYIEDNLSSAGASEGYIIKLYNLQRHQCVHTIVPMSLNTSEYVKSWVNRKKQQNVTTAPAWGEPIEYKSALFNYKSSSNNITKYRHPMHTNHPSKPVNNIHMNEKLHSLLSSKLCLSTTDTSSLAKRNEYIPSYSLQVPEHLIPCTVEKENMHQSPVLFNHVVSLLSDWLQSMNVTIPSIIQQEKPITSLTILEKPVQDVTSLLYHHETKSIVVGVKDCVLTVQ